MHSLSQSTFSESLYYAPTFPHLSACSGAGFPQQKGICWPVAFSPSLSVQGVKRWDLKSWECRSALPISYPARPGPLCLQLTAERSRSRWPLRCWYPILQVRMPFRAMRCGWVTGGGGALIGTWHLSSKALTASEFVKTQTQYRWGWTFSLRP